MKRRTAVRGGVAVLGVAALTWWIWPEGAVEDCPSSGSPEYVGDDAHDINRRLRSAHPGEEVRLPFLARGYTIRTPVRIPAGVVLRCDPTSPLRARGELASMVIFQGPRGRLVGATLETGTASVSSIIHMRSVAQGSMVEACRLVAGRATSIGVRAHGQQMGTRVSRCSIAGASTGVSFVGSGRDVSITSTTISEWQQRGIYIQQRGSAPFINVTLDHNTVEHMRGGGSSRYPIVVTGTSVNRTRHLVLTRNTVTGPERPYRDPRQPGTADQLAVRHAQTFLVAGNNSTGGGEVGITVAHCQHGKVRHNMVAENDTTGIYIGSRDGFTTSGIVVEGNRCENNGQNRMENRRESGRAGIRVVDSVRVIVKENVLVDTQRQATQLSGVALDNSRKVRLEGNSITGSKTRILRTGE